MFTPSTNKPGFNQTRTNNPRTNKLGQKKYSVGILAPTLSLLLALPLASYAATEVPAVVVSAARTEQSTLSTPAAMTIITRKQIDASGASHVVDVLRGQGGVQINDTYGDGSRATVDMRGFGDTAGSNTLVLIDGRRLNNPDIGAPDLNSIALEDVERIEIVQGSAGVLFGDQAVGGVINIITSKPGALKHSLKLSAGSYNTVDFHGVTSQSLDNGLNYRVALDVRDSDNYRDHNEASYINGFGKLGYEYNSGSVFAELQYIDEKLNLPGALFADEVAADRKQVAPNSASDFSNTETKVGRLGVVQEISDNWSFEGELTERDTGGVFHFGAVAPDSTQDRKVREFTPRFIGFIPRHNAILTVGADVIESDYRLKSFFGEQTNDQSQRSIYVQAVVSQIPDFDITIGVRHARVNNDLRGGSNFPTGVNVDDSLTVGTFGIAYKANQNWRLMFRADQNYRFAKVDEYLFASPFFAPPSTVILKTQEGLSIEGGIEWHQNGHRAAVSIYRLDLDNELTFDPVFGANINLDSTERKGIITSGRWQASKRLGVSASYTYTDAKVVSGALAGKNVPFVAKNMAFVSTDYAISKAWFVYGEIVSISNRTFSGDFNNVLGRLPGYGLLNMKLEYTQKDFSITGRVNNVLDKQYSDVGPLGFAPPTFAPKESFYTSPEINFLLTAAWKFR